MHIAITGATGMVGTALGASLRTAGHSVISVSRQKTPGSVLWDPARGEIDLRGLAGIDAAIHLAGENLAAGRWTPALKERIWQSRTAGTALFSEALAALDSKPRVLVSVSAIGFYGYRHGDTWLDETMPPGDDFLAKLCVAWEGAAEPARTAGIRVVHPRIGLILSPNGGALAKMLPPFRLGLGGRLGSGNQWMSWITLDDLVSALTEAVLNDSLHGPVNLAAPNPVRNAEFTQILAATLDRPAILPLPAAALRLVFGEMADLTLLASLRISSQRLASSGFQFRYPELRGALEHLLAGTGN